jgi:hypothetical protein
MSILLDPTSEHTPQERQRVPRPAQLTGLTVGLLDMSKARGNIFLDRIEWQLTEKGLTVQRYRKPTFARIAPVDLKHQISTECDLVIEALAD